MLTLTVSIQKQNPQLHHFTRWYAVNGLAKVI